MTSMFPEGDGSGEAWDGSYVGASFRDGFVARVLAVLFAAGATLALITLALPHPEQADDVGLLATIGNAYLVAVLLSWRAERLPAHSLCLALAWGSVSIAAAGYFSGESPSPVVFFYLWVFLYAAYFFTLRQATGQIVFAALAYGVLLVTRTPDSLVWAWWLVGTGTLTVGALVIATMRARVERLVERLYEATRTDPLTKLANRRGFRDLLDLDLERARRSGVPLGVLIGDLDDFKDVNDLRGHGVGDQALQRAAAVLDQGKRKIDVVARIGGEEFALILPDAAQEDCLEVAERLRRAIRAEFAGDPFDLTISFGLSLYPQHGETAAALLHAADEALYAAKQGGRNRTVPHTPAVRNELRLCHDERDIESERFIAAVLEMAEAVDLRFSGSARHSETVGRYAEMMSRELGLSEWRTSRVRLAGILHDIGKSTVANAILHKPGPLTEEEYEVIKRHPKIGAQMLEHVSLSDVREWVAMHHERPDGRGYPLGLSGEAVPLEARIVAVADAYEAMTSERPYREAMGHEQALDELRRCAGTQFDATVVEAFVNALCREALRVAEALPAGA